MQFFSVFVVRLSLNEKIKWNKEKEKNIDNDLNRAATINQLVN